MATGIRVASGQHDGSRVERTAPIGEAQRERRAAYRQEWRERRRLEATNGSNAGEQRRAVTPN